MRNSFENLHGWKNELEIYVVCHLCIKNVFVFVQRIGTAVICFIFHLYDLFTHKWANVSVHSDIQLNPLFP